MGAGGTKKNYSGEQNISEVIDTCRNLGTATVTLNNVSASGGGTLITAPLTGKTITITGFTGGVDGQRIRLLKINDVGTVTFTYNSAASTQKIITPTKANISLTTTPGMVEFICWGGQWFMNRP